MLAMLEHASTMTCDAPGLPAVDAEPLLPQPLELELLVPLVPPLLVPLVPPLLVPLVPPLLVPLVPPLLVPLVPPLLVPLVPPLLVPLVLPLLVPLVLPLLVPLVLPLLVPLVLPLLVLVLPLLALPVELGEELAEAVGTAALPENAALWLVEVPLPQAAKARLENAVNKFNVTVERRMRDTCNTWKLT